MQTDSLEYSAPVTRATPLDKHVHSLSTNRPWYLGVPLAIAHHQPTEHVIAKKLVAMPDRICRGARALHLVDEHNQLTELGAEVVQRVDRHSTIQEDLNWFASQQGTATRFADIAPSYWMDIATDIVTQFEPAATLIEILNDTENCTLTLPELGLTLLSEYPRLSHAFFTTSTELLNADRDTQHTAVYRPQVYHGTAVYQFPSLLYHLGVLVQSGTDTSALVPEHSVWGLDPSFRGESQ